MTDIADRFSKAVGDRYRLERRLGEGGMATVYLAHDLKHDRKVALKVLRPELAAVVGAQRFLQEIKTTANLQHPHILPLFDSGEADGFVYYVMPYVEGESLRQRLAGGPLTQEEATRLMRDVADALAYAHSQGVVHRDIKPDNVMVSRRHAVVMDFGVARAVSEAAEQRALTTVGMTVGTPAYMAPEQAAADPAVDHRADLYAFGAMAYELLTGTPPFVDSAPQKVLAAHISRAPRPLTETRPDVREGLEDLVMRCLAKQPDGRWSTADEIVRRLETLATPQAGTLAVSARSSKPNKRTMAMIGSVAVALLAAIAVGVLRPGSEPAAPVSSSSVAVFPFAVRGDPDVQYLGEGMVNLLAASMDGAGDLRSVDPRAVLARVRQEELDVIAPGRAAGIARDLGAGLFILGDIVEVGDRLRVDAALYGPEGGAEPAGTAMVDGAPQDILGMVDRVASQLLASEAAGGGSRVTQLAAVTTSSLEALKLYLEGESAFRGGRFDPAVEAFQAAVAADSQFALAYYRLSVAAEWALRPDIALPAAERAVQLADRLSDRDRRLLEGLLAYREGDAREAERVFRAVLAIWPQDVEAWIQLGEVQFHYSLLLGQSITRSREAFERVLALEPDNPLALIHMLRIAARSNDTLAVDSLGGRLSELTAEGARALEIAVLWAVVPPDSARLEAVAGEIRRAPEIEVPQATFSAAIWTDAFAVIRPLLEMSTEPSRSMELRALAHVHSSHLEALQGRFGAARRELTAAAALNPHLALEHRALFLLQPFAAVSQAEVEALRDTLQAWDAQRVPQSPIPNAHFAIHDDLHSGLRLYLLGLANVRLGALPAATALAERLERLPGTPSAASLDRVLADGVRAAVARARGNLEEAARFLEGAEDIGNYESAMFSPFLSRASERFHRAVLLDSLGQTDEAERLYRSFEDFNLYDRFFAAPARLRAGRLAEREGRLADAERHYERFVFLWADADAEYQPLVDEARAALRRLEGAVGSDR